MGAYRHRAKRALNAGIDVNSKYTENDDPSEWSLPIHLACDIYDAQMAKILVEAGADPSAIDSCAGESAIEPMAGRQGSYAWKCTDSPLLGDSRCKLGWLPVTVAIPHFAERSSSKTFLWQKLSSRLAQTSVPS